MKLPPALKLKNTAHGTSLKGLAFYVWEDIDGLGVIRESRREHRGAAFVETWRYRWLPDHVFPTYGQLARAVDAVTDEAIAAECAKWPQIADLADLGADSDNRCLRHRDQRAVVSMWLRDSWVPGDGAYVCVCQGCRDLGINAATVAAVVKERRAAVAARNAAEGR